MFDGRDRHVSALIKLTATLTKERRTGSFKGGKEILNLCNRSDRTPGRTQLLVSLENPGFDALNSSNAECSSAISASSRRFFSFTILRAQILCKRAFKIPPNR